MSDQVIFKELPETFPQKDKYKKPSMAGGVVCISLVILVLLAVPFFMPQRISRGELLVRLVAPPLPPPPPAAPPSHAPAIRPNVVKAPEQPIKPDALIVPTQIPKEVANLIDAPAAVDEPGGVIGGVPGGVPGGLPGGVLGGILSASASVAPPPAAPAPPPAPPKVQVPSGPVRVGGMVKQPQLLKVVSPVFPRLARQAHVTGTVVLEAVVTAEGTVSEIKVISGHPLLIQAAIDCVKEWRYQPTLLNGIPTPVILTAKVHFDTGAPIS